MLKVFYFTVEL